MAKRFALVALIFFFTACNFAPEPASYTGANYERLLASKEKEARNVLDELLAKTNVKEPVNFKTQEKLSIYIEMDVSGVPTIYYSKRILINSSSKELHVYLAHELGHLLAQHHGPPSSLIENFQQLQADSIGICLVDKQTYRLYLKKWLYPEEIPQYEELLETMGRANCARYLR